MQATSTRNRRGGTNIWNSRSHHLTGYILTEEPDFDTRSITRRTLREPGFLRSCERVLFGLDDGEMEHRHTSRPVMRDL